MIFLVLIGLAAGVVTAVSPCVLPVLPVLLAGGAAGRKPLRIVAGLALSFSVFTLFAAWILDQLGLPQDTLREAAIVLLFLLAATLLVPRLALLLERPLAVFSRLRPRGVGGGFWLGATLGLVFVPCAGPVLATITVVAAHDEVGWRAIVLTVAYAIGAAVPMLIVATGGRAASGRLRERAATVRAASGVLIAAVAFVLVFHLDDQLATLTPGYTDFLQTKVEAGGSATRALAEVRGGKAPLKAKKTAGDGIPVYGAAPALHPDGAWINSPPLTIEGLRGKVVLVDFWTYSCINCLRTVPPLEGWYRTYGRDGLVVLGVHTPEFAFEHVTSNVRDAVKRLGIRYPVVQDNGYGTWDAYANEYWPAEYLVDRQGRVRHVDFGEGNYGETENLIRRLLGVAGARAAAVPDVTPTEAMTPETYLGYKRLQSYQGSPLAPDKAHVYTLPRQLPENAVAYGGTWTVGGESILARRDARLRLHFHAKDVYLVLGGTGTVHELIDGRPAGTLNVDAYRLYTVRSGALADAILELRFSPGVRAYSFTFG